MPGPVPTPSLAAIVLSGATLLAMACAILAAARWASARDERMTFPVTLDERITTWRMTPLRLGFVVIGIAAFVTFVVSGLVVSADTGFDLRWVLGPALWLVICEFVATRTSFRGYALPLALIVATVVTTAWLRWPNWVTLSVAAMLLAIATTSNVSTALRRAPLAFFAVLGVGVVIADVYAVFHTGAMLELVSHARQLPILLRVWPQLAGMLGLGDVFWPGLILLSAARVDARLWTAGMIGYAAGFAVAWSFTITSGVAQPALVYLVPGVLGGLAQATYRLGLPWAAWNGALPVDRYDAAG